MNKLHISVSLLIILFISFGSFESLHAFQQTDTTAIADSVKQLGQKDELSLSQKVDSLVEDKITRLDSLARVLQQNIENVTEADTTTVATDDSEQAIAQLQEVISWRKILFIILFFILTYYFTSFLSAILDNFSERTSKYRLKIKRMVPIARVLIWTIAIYIAIAGIIQPPYATIITVMASVGIAVGLASQDVLKNLFGGIMLILDRPFQVGDKIQFQDYYGEVLQIGLRSARIVTPGDSVVTIPNGELIRTAVSNANTGALDCLVVTNIYLPADCPVEEVKQIAYKAVISSRFVFMKKPISIMTENEMHQRRFILKVKVKAYVLDIRYEFPFQSDVTELILTELQKRNILKDELRIHSEN
ncbi:mechanosensitive ion channel family protein [Gracilimonas sp. Q87]|uniref:mechanosensitive ion channel family protein n=1 Tax=Gracilimonas sp. Q87 TaxID=3384766 RepID=UPI003984201C